MSALRLRLKRTVPFNCPLAPTSPGTGPLCFICKQQQAMNIVLERFFVTGVVVKPHIVIVALYVYFSACGTAIAEPSAVKEPATPPRNERPKVLNGGLKGYEVRAEKSVNVLGPNRSMGVYGIKLYKDGGTKGDTGSSTAIMTLSPEREAMRGESRKESTDKGYQCDGYCGLYFSLPLWIVAYWIALRPMKHNV